MLYNIFLFLSYYSPFSAHSNLLLLQFCFNPSVLHPFFITKRIFITKSSQSAKSLMCVNNKSLDTTPPPPPFSPPHQINL